MLQARVICRVAVVTTRRMNRVFALVAVMECLSLAEVHHCNFCYLALASDPRHLDKFAVLWLPCMNFFSWWAQLALRSVTFTVPTGDINLSRMRQCD